MFVEACWPNRHAVSIENYGLSDIFPLTAYVAQPNMMGMDLKDILKAAGGGVSLSIALELSHSTVFGWTRVPSHHVPAVARITGLDRHRIRPDLYEEPAPMAAADERAA